MDHYSIGKLMNEVSSTVRCDRYPFHFRLVFFFPKLDKICLTPGFDSYIHLAITGILNFENRTFLVKVMPCFIMIHNVAMVLILTGRKNPVAQYRSFWDTL